MKLNFSISLRTNFFFFFFNETMIFHMKYSLMQIFIHTNIHRTEILVRKNRRESGRHKVPISDVISRLTFKTGNFVNMSHEVCMVRAIERQRRRRPRSTFHHIDAACDQKLIKVFSIRRDLKLVIYTRVPEERK